MILFYISQPILPPRLSMTNNASKIRQEPQSLRIIPVAGDQLMRQFIELPWSLYANDPCWVPPLLIERKWHLSKKNPYFQHADFQAWVACRGERVVGYAPGLPSAGVEPGPRVLAAAVAGTDCRQRQPSGTATVVAPRTSKRRRAGATHGRVHVAKDGLRRYV